MRTYENMPSFPLASRSFNPKNLCGYLIRQLLPLEGAHAFPVSRPHVNNKPMFDVYGYLSLISLIFNEQILYCVCNRHFWSSLRWASLMLVMSRRVLID